MGSDLVWEGKIGTVPLRVEVPHAGRINSEWELPDGRRQKSCTSAEEFERSVLFQVLVASGETDTGIAQEILQAVTIAETERPAPHREAPAKVTKKKKGGPRRHRRSRTPPRRR